MGGEAKSDVLAAGAVPGSAVLFSGLMEFARGQDLMVGLLALGIHVVLGSLMFAGTVSLLLRAYVRGQARSIFRSLGLGFLMDELASEVKPISFWKLWGGALLGTIVLAGLTTLVLTALGASRDAWAAAVGTYAVAVGAHLFVLDVILLVALVLAAVMPLLSEAVLVSWLGAYFIGAYEIWYAGSPGRVAAGLPLLVACLVLLFGIAVAWLLSVYVLVRAAAR